MPPTGYGGFESAYRGEQGYDQQNYQAPSVSIKHDSCAVANVRYGAQHHEQCGLPPAGPPPGQYQPT